MPGESAGAGLRGDLGASFGVAGDEQQADVASGRAQLADDAEQQGFLARPGRRPEQHDRAGVGAETQVGAEARAFVGGHRRVRGDVELDVAGERRREAEFAEAADVALAAGGDLLEVSEHVAGEFQEALMAGEGFIGEASVDEEGGNAAGARLGEVFRPELAFDEDDGVGLDPAPGERAAGPEVGREEADAVGHFGVTVPRHPVAGAGRRGQDDLGRPGGLELTKQRADGLDFAHRDRLNPKTTFPGRLPAEFWEEPEPLAEPGAIAPAADHPPKIVG